MALPHEKGLEREIVLRRPHAHRLEAHVLPDHTVRRCYRRATNLPHRSTLGFVMHSANGDRKRTSRHYQSVAFTKRMGEAKGAGEIFQFLSRQRCSRSGPFFGRRKKLKWERRVERAE